MEKLTKSQFRALHQLELGRAVEAKYHELDVLRALIQAGYAAPTPYKNVDGEQQREVHITDAGRAALERSEG